jgi:hypothetical protein
MEWNVARAATVTSSRTYAGIVSSMANQLDPADATMASFAIVNSSAELATYTAGTDPFYIGVNQRASYRWVAAPGSEIVMPATSSAALGIRSRSGGYTGTSTITCMFQEQ